MCNLAIKMLAGGTSSVLTDVKLRQRAQFVSTARTLMFDEPVGGGFCGVPFAPRSLASPFRPGFVVAVPVKDEEDRLPVCLRALAHQFDRFGRPIPPELLRVAL
jgi:hypothetical protein